MYKIILSVHACQHMCARICVWYEFKCLSMFWL